jgi:HPt (histidine-containing phosphotransfer) domain-containing protein
MMDKAILYDLSFLNKISNSDENFIKEMVVTFKNTAPATVTQMEECVRNNKYSALSKHAHKFISGISFLGIKYIEEDLLKIEDYSKRNINLEEILGLIENVKGNVNRLIVQFNKDFNLE